LKEKSGGAKTNCIVKQINFYLGVIAAQLNTKLLFDRQKKVVTNHPLANQMLVGKVPRKGWEQYYNL
jgi:hypothetical protein